MPRAFQISNEPSDSIRNSESPGTSSFTIWNALMAAAYPANKYDCSTTSRRIETDIFSLSAVRISFRNDDSSLIPIKALIRDIIRIWRSDSSEAITFERGQGCPVTQDWFASH